MVSALSQPGINAGPTTAVAVKPGEPGYLNQIIAQQKCYGLELEIARVKPEFSTQFVVPLTKGIRLMHGKCEWRVACGECQAARKRVALSEEINSILTTTINRLREKQADAYSWTAPL